MRFHTKVRLCTRWTWGDRTWIWDISKSWLQCTSHIMSTLNPEYNSSVWEHLSFHINFPLIAGQLLHMVFQLSWHVYKTGYTWIYGSFEIFFKDNSDYLGLSLYVLTLETNLLQEVRWDFTLRDGGGGETWKSFLKAKGNTDKGKKETTNVNFCVTTLATPSNLGKKVVAL